MSPSLLPLASAHLERAGNPAFGRRVNDDAVFELATMLSDAETTDRFRNEVQLLDDADAFGAYGWLWLIGWCKVNDVDLADQLLLDLVERWEATSFKAEVFDLLIRSADIGGDALTIEDFPHPLLRRILLQAVTESEADEEEPERSTSRSLHTRHAETTLFALIAVDRPIADAAARVLVAHEWSGRDRLRRAVLGRVELLDDETGQLWRDGLGLAPIPEDV